MDDSDNKNDVAFKMNGDWKEQAMQLKSKYTQLTDEDLIYESGKVSYLLKRIEARLNKSREEVVAIIRKVQPSNGLIHSKIPS